VQHGLLHGHPAPHAQRRPPEFTDEVVNRPDVQAMIQKVDFGVHPDADAAGYDKMTTIIEIALKGGRLVSGRAGFGRAARPAP
jgi:hypothetical protein